MRIEASGGLELGLDSKKFSMKSNAKAFAILSSGLYSNKIRAVIRELSCNAYDSHIEAGNEKTPFDIFLPTYNESTFYVRDYGTGLSEENIYKIYTTYFESTKSESNEYTGALGLGSKSPFCVANNFTIDSYYDNKHMTFVAFIGKSGTPELSKLSEVDTIEPNGVKVTVAVETSTHRWLFEAREVLAWFPTEPNIICSDIVTPDKIEFTQSLTPSTQLMKDYSGSIVVVQGTVAYNISVDDMSTHFDHYGVLSHMPLCINVPIGAVDITASREAISFVDYTVEHLTEEFAKILQSLKDAVDEAFLLCDGNPWQMFLTNRTLREVYPSQIVDESQVLLSHPNKMHGTSNRKFTMTGLEYLIKKEDVVTMTSFNTVNSKISRGPNSKQIRHLLTVGGSETLVIVNDANRGILPTVRLHLLNYRHIDRVLLIDFKNRNKYSTRVVNNILREIKNPPNVIYASKMERPVTARQHTAKGKDLKITIKRFGKFSTKLETQELNLDNLHNTYCVNLENHTIADANFTGGVHNLISVLDNLPPHFFNSRVLCGVTKSQKRLLDNRGIEIKSLFPEVESYIRTLGVDDINMHIPMHNDVPRIFTQSQFISRIDDGECAVPSLVDVVRFLQKQQSRHGVHLDALKIVVDRLSLSVSFDKVTDVIDQRQLAADENAKVAASIKRRCPMIAYFKTGWQDTDLSYTILMQYINGQY